MFKGLKMVVAGLYSITKEGLNDDIFSDASMKHNITESMHNVRAVLCLFDVSNGKLMQTIQFLIYAFIKKCNFIFFFIEKNM